MSSSDKEKAGEKPGKKKQKRSRKAEQAQSPVPDQQQAARELIDVTVAAAAASPIAAAAPSEPPPPQAPPIVEAASAEADPPGAAKADKTPPVGLQTIASAYRDYTRKSLEDARSYVEKLSGVRSLDKAVEVQTEFARQAYETFAADSRRIRDLYGEFFKQTMRLPMSPFDRPRDR